MKYLCAIFVPPLYFLTRKKWGQFVVNSLIYGFACVLVLTLALIFVAPFVWLIAVSHALFNLRKESRAEYADILATKMAEKMSPTQKPAEPTV